MFSTSWEGICKAGHRKKKKNDFVFIGSRMQFLFSRKPSKKKKHDIDTSLC